MLYAGGQVTNLTVVNSTFATGTAGLGGCIYAGGVPGTDVVVEGTVFDGCVGSSGASVGLAEHGFVACLPSIAAMCWCCFHGFFV